jgi:acetyl-CoA carboxylase biotin carboxyl carrier protein
MADSARDSQQPSSDDAFGLSAVREIVALLSQTDITELQLERDGARLHIRRDLSARAGIVVASAAAFSAEALPATDSGAGAALDFDHLQPGQSAITAPMVGTYYAAASPKDRPYVEEGDIIQLGTPVGIIEAMKMMNEIKSEVSGQVVRVLVKNSQPVEYGQILMIVEPL